LQLEGVKRIVTAAQTEEVGCRSCRRASWEADESRGCPDKWLLREVAERRGASAKRSLSEEVAQQRKVAHSSIHPPTHQIHSPVHLFMNLSRGC